jgi:hypothetical protein
MAKSQDAVFDIYLSDHWRVRGGPRTESDRAELRDRLIPLVIKAFGSVESSLDLLLKESPCARGHGVTTLIRAYQLLSLQLAREAAEAQDQAKEQRLEGFSDEFGELDLIENRTTAAAEKVRAILRVDICQLPANLGGTTVDSAAAVNLPSWQQVRDQFLLGAGEYPNVLAQWESGQRLWTLLSGPENEVAKPEALSLFKEAARMAVGLLGGRLDKGPSWQVWLDHMREKNRGFRKIALARSFHDVRVFLESETLPAGIPLGESGTIPHVFQESADFCEDIGATVGRMASRTSVDGASAAAQAPVAPSFNAEQVSGTMSRSLGVIREDPSPKKGISGLAGDERQAAPVSFDSIQKAHAPIDWGAIAAIMEANSADIAKVEEAMGSAIPLTPRNSEETIELLGRFSTDPKGLGLTAEQFGGLESGSQWLQHYHIWERSRRNLMRAKGRGGRPPKNQTREIHAEWVRVGKPKRTAAVCDRIAQTFFTFELEGLLRGSPQHRKVRERVRQAIQRVERRSAT